MINIASAKGFAPTYKLEVADTIVDFNGSPHRMIKMRITGSSIVLKRYVCPYPEWQADGRKIFHRPILPSMIRRFMAFSQSTSCPVMWNLAMAVKALLSSKELNGIV